MPNARVGAMPNTQAMNQEEYAGGRRKTKARGQKGITMEDLKQQTKARLAKEQRRRDAVTASRNTRGKILSQDNRKTRGGGLGALTVFGIGSSSAGASANPKSIDVSASCDNSIGSSSFQSNQTPLYSQHSVDDFHSSAGSNVNVNFDFMRPDNQNAGARGAQSRQQQPEQIQNYENLQYSQQLQAQASHQSHSPLKPHTNNYPGVQMKYSGNNQNQNNKSHNPQYQNQTPGAGPTSNTSKLPHGLTVQELKEMTRARLAAEAAEGKDQEKDIRLVASTSSDTSVSASGVPHLAYNKVQPTFQHEMTGNSVFNRQRILSADSFGSVERQRLGSVESFGSAPSAYAASGYHPHQNFLRKTISQDAPEQPSVSSFSYDAQDTESYVSAIGSESFFGSETHVGSTVGTVTSNAQNMNSNTNNPNAITPKYSGNSSSIYTLPFTSNSQLSPMSHANKKVTNNIHRDGWTSDISVARASSPVSSSIPNISHSAGGSFGSGGGAVTESNQGGSSFFASLPIGKFERSISAGGVVPNSVAESVLGPSFEENNLGDDSNMFQNYNPPNNLVSPQIRNVRNNDRSMPFSFPWSVSKHRQSEDNSGDLNISQLQNEWESRYLNVGGKDEVDDFPLSTFKSKASSAITGSNYVGSDLSPDNRVFASPFQPVPEEQVIHNLASLDVNVPERFHDDNIQELSIPKIGNKFRRKKSRS